MVHGHLVIEAHVEGTRSIRTGESLLPELIASEYRSSCLGLVKSGELLVNAGEGQQREQARREY